MSTTRCFVAKNSWRRGTKSERFALPRTMSASKRAAAASGKAWGMQPVSTVIAPGLSFLARRSAWRTLWSLWAVTVQELTTTTPAASSGAAWVKPAASRASSMAWDSY